MTLSQLRYIIAVDTYKSFGLAAEKCFVTQPALSLQIQKLEEELEVKLFDRSKKPVIPTDAGLEVIKQARVILQEVDRLGEILAYKKQEIAGELKLGIIPTLAPYLLPLFLVKFLEKYPAINLKVSEMTTEQIIHKLKNGILDVGILATPLGESTLREAPLFYEPLVGYVSPQSDLYAKKQIQTLDLMNEELWLLDEGHCLRSQILNICDESQRYCANLQYQTGSIEALKRIVELNRGVTILPELSIQDFRTEQMEMVRYFEAPEPVREISLVTHRQDIKKKLIQLLQEEIIDNIPKKMKIPQNKQVIDIRMG